MGRWTYFTDEEAAGVDAELMASIDRARHRAGIPFTMTCGVRTPEENSKVHGVADSAHMTGHAVDLRCQNSEQCFKIIEALLHEGLQRIVIGIKPTGKDQDEFYHNIHVDNDSTKPTPCLAVKLYE